LAGNMNNLHAFRFNFAADVAGNYDFVCTRGWRQLDQICGWNATAGTSLRVSRSTAAAPTVFNNAGPVLNRATVDDIEYAETLVDAQSTFATGDTMRVVSVGTCSADLIIEVLPTTWIAG
jgi:hypothetical protein